MSSSPSLEECVDWAGDSVLACCFGEAAFFTLGLGSSSELLSTVARRALIFDWGVSGVPGGEEASEGEGEREGAIEYHK